MDSNSERRKVRKVMQLLIVDTAQIQPYIFGSNRLKENIGASHLVWLATKQWAFEALPKPHNMIKPPAEFKDWDFADVKIEDSNQTVAAEVVYAGGGNVVVLFREKEDADLFERRLSCRVLKDAPGLQLVIVQKAFDWLGKNLKTSITELFRELAKQKNQRALSAPLLGLGVTRRCQSTGLPAVGLVPEADTDEAPMRAVSAEISAKLENVAPANQRLKKMFNDTLGETFEFPYQLDHMGRTEEDYSYIAVVHADGDGMGHRLGTIGANLSNRNYINTVRQFSQSLQKAAQAAFSKTVNSLPHDMEKRVTDNKGEFVWKINGNGMLIPSNVGGEELTRIKLRNVNNSQNWWYLPFRPLVFGGDDITFVCDGRFGLALAQIYMMQFERLTENLPEGKATASAGIAVVKVHYPFSRAYSLAVDLSKKAKAYHRKIKDEARQIQSCLDWHFALSGLAGDIDEIRKREYELLKEDERYLTLRPITLNANPIHSHRSWVVVNNGIRSFRSKEWFERKNKLHALQEALRKGKQEVKWFVQKFNDGRDLPDIDPSLADMKTSGWHGPYCGYFDALELVDWFIPLDGEE
jgi:hypothetical protein